jgi:hypothetical protein
MRNKLPILLALSLCVLAIAPLLRSLDWRQLIAFARPTTVPPPNAMNATKGSGGSSSPLGEGQSVGTGSGPTAPPTPGRTKPQTLIDYSVQAVEGQQYISAQVSESGEMLAHPLAGSGRYFEVRQGPIPMIHLEMTLQIDTVSTSLVQVCDNRGTFWTYSKLPNRETLSKLDAVRAITALDQAAGRMPPGNIMTTPGFGGLGRLMRGVNAEFDFATASPDELDGTPVWKLTGGWKQNELARLLPEQKDAAAKGRPFNLARLPARLPDGVVAYLRRTDYFPLRIDYLRGATGSSPQCLLSIRFSDVSFRGPIDSSQFLFTPGSLEFNDRTDDFVRKLGVER